MPDNQVGAIIEQGPSDWQIVQRDADGVGSIALRGRWVADVPGTVEVRLAVEETGVAVNRALDWHAAETLGDHTWTATLADIPAGGLYRLETRFNPQGNIAGEWSTRGDIRHFLGVGDLWVIAGQSNSAGYGRGPCFDPPELGVHLFRNSETWALATHPLNASTDTRHPCNREGGNPAHSPYLHFARVLKQHLGVPIGLVQTSLGGSPLSAWNPAEPGTPVLYRNMLHCIELVGGRVRGVVWYQGESDTGPEQAPTYEERFTKAVRAWRDDLRSPGLAVITVQLNRVYQPPNEEADRGWSQVREAQRQVARKLEGVAVVPAFDLPLADGIHTSPAGNMLLGERMARTALGAIYGQPINYLAPDLVSAKARQDRTAVELAFEPVTSRMECIDPQANCFRIEDEAGDVPVKAAAYTGSARVLLSLGRALEGQTVVHGGYGATPQAVPMDVERFLPMLGFYGVEVE